MEDLELISLLNECNKMSVLEVSNYLLGKMDYLSRIKSDKSNKILMIRNPISIRNSFHGGSYSTFL